MHTPLRTRSALSIFVEYAFRVDGLPTRRRTLSFFCLALPPIADGNTDLARFGIIPWLNLVIADGTTSKALNTYA
jgi:hypothetical protein